MVSHCQMEERDEEWWSRVITTPPPPHSVMSDGAKHVVAPWLWWQCYAAMRY